MPLIGKIAIIIAAIVLALWLYDLCIRTWMKFRNREPVRTATAKVVFKEVQTSTLTNENSYSVCFLTTEGKPVELFPNEAEYNGLQLDQHGELTYQGLRFISFKEIQ